MYICAFSYLLFYYYNELQTYSYSSVAYHRLSCYCAKPAITHVVTHNRSTVICGAAKGANPYPAWGVFPKAESPVRKITVHVTLGSPDSLNAAHWDYLDHIVLRRKGGAKGEELNYELGR